MVSLGELQPCILRFYRKLDSRTWLFHYSATNIFTEKFSVESVRDRVNSTMKNVDDIVEDDENEDDKDSDKFFDKALAIQDPKKNNTLLMELAIKMKDDALREVLTNSATTNSVRINKKVLLFYFLQGYICKFVYYLHLFP